MHNDLETETEVESLGVVGRRRFIGWVSAAACGTMFSIREAKAGLFYSTKPVEGIPQAWVNSKGLEVLRYANYIKGLKLKNVSPYMVLYPHFKTRGRQHNSIPPRYMWKNITATLKVIDAMASRMGARPKPFTTARKMRTEGLFKGGVGSYSSFTHVDTRGQNADW